MQETMKEVLKGIDLFAGFTDSELEQIAKYVIPKKYEKDEIIVKCNDLVKELFFVLTGKVVSTLKLPGSIERKNGLLQGGDFFGEVAVFGNKPHLYTYIAAETCELLVIEEVAFINLMEKNHELATKLISGQLCQTIRQFRKSSRFLADVVQWGENASRRVITDEQTGIYNRAFLDDAIESFFNISKSNNKPLSFMMLDVDNCRKINEQIDMETGNKIIFQIVAIIRSIISKQGIVARYGGDEFSILLPETNLQQALSMGEQIRVNIEKFDFSKILKNTKIPITTSIGISAFPENAVELETFKSKADVALYKAKEGGKNRVVFIE